MKKILMLLLLIPGLVSAQKSSIRGKAFFDYNDNVKNKADVGARIVLISKNDKEFHQETTADLSGNYSFQDVTPGDYLLILTSKNTKEEPVTSVESLMLYSDFLNDWSEGLAQQFQTAKYDSLQNKIREFKDNRDSHKFNEKKLQAMKQSVNDLITQFYAQLPLTAIRRLDLKSPADKMKFELIKVGNTELNVVTEFGISAH
jgi:hypothetical protein